MDSLPKPHNAVGVFFSPPEAHMPDTFHSPVRQPHNPIAGKGFRDVRLPSIRQILSPPVSPATRLDQEHGMNEVPHDSRIKDPELFPHRPSMTQIDASQPLFRPIEHDLSVAAVVDDHIQAKAATAVRHPAPSRDEYILAASFRGKVFERYNADPERYMRQELEFLAQYPKMFAPPATAVKRRGETDNRAVKRQKVASRSAIEKLPIVRRAPRNSPRELPLDNTSTEPAPIKHRRKPSHTAPLPREDMDFRKLPDLSPAVSTMAVGKNLKVDWKGHPLDLSSDPDRHMLDEQEATLASILRLTAGQYLFAKRKIFERYVELARIGKDFNKTSAQAVCHIDVNKASKLWTAFEKVGWFDRRHFAQYL